MLLMICATEQGTPDALREYLAKIPVQGGANTDAAPQATVDRDEGLEADLVFFTSPYHAGIN
jgi:hypothetical protein